MRTRKSERRNQFIEVQEQIQSISNEIYSPREYITAVVDETDLSLRKLEELHRQLLALQKDKSERLKKVQNHLYTLNSLCSVLGLDFKQTVSGVHPSLGNSEGPKSVNNDAINQLAIAIQELREVKLQRMQRLQDLASTMLELWNLMDTPIEEQQMFQNVTCNIAASEHEVTEPNSLSENNINYVEAEVSRLEKLKSSKMKELVLKKRAELEEICQKTHLIPEIDSAVEYAVEAIESGSVDPACVLEQIELQIAQVKEEAFARKETLEKLRNGCQHVMKSLGLRSTTGTKIDTMLGEVLILLSSELRKPVPWLTKFQVRLLSMLEDYTLSRQEKEQERRRQRDLKKLQGQLIVEKEVLYGSKPSPSKAQSAKKTPRMSTGSTASRRVSLGCQTPKPDSIATPFSTRKTDKALDDDASCLSSARRGLDIAGVPMKKYSIGAGVPLTRQPFSPISLTVSSKANVEVAADDLNTQNVKLQKTLAVSNFPSIPNSKTTTVVDEENRTPKAMPIYVPTTPLKVSIPMNMSMTPAPSSVPYGGDLVQEIEYSFEERRLGFVLA
ncbi:65-kDa microtubule-associated protein 3 [Spatholobus suberectus]|nr:65-kDa microtubule-associated protein 3 [Spatholobus suberectus]